MNAVDDTNKRMGTPTSGVDKKAHDTVSIFRKVIAAELDPDEPLLAVTHCAVATAGRPEDVILILLTDRLFAVWDVGPLLIKAHVVVVPYASVKKATVERGSGEYEGAVVLEVDSGEVLTLGLLTADPSNAQFMLDIIRGTRDIES